MVSVALETANLVFMATEREVQAGLHIVWLHRNADYGGQPGSWAWAEINGDVARAVSICRFFVFPLKPRMLVFKNSLG